MLVQLVYRLFYGAPSASLMNFGDSLSQFLAQIGRFGTFQAGARGAIKQTIDQLHQHHGAEDELRHLPDQQEDNHPQHPQQDGFVLGFCFRLVHVSLSLMNQLKPLVEIKSTSVFGSPRINNSIT